jgi:hypothetical protein
MVDSTRNVKGIKSFGGDTRYAASLRKTKYCFWRIKEAKENKDNDFPVFLEYLYFLLKLGSWQSWSGRLKPPVPGSF